jgi:hypothetical protein
MKTHSERLATIAAEREQHEAERAAAHRRAKQIRVEADDLHAVALADLEQRERTENDEASAAVNALGDERHAPIVKSLFDEASNRAIIALIEAVEASDALALGGTGEVFPLRRVALQLAELHRQERPGIVGPLTAPRAWYSASGGGFGAPEFADELRKAVARHDVAGARAAFEALDARLWRFTAQPVAEGALEAWQALCNPDPRAFAAHAAETAKREAEEQVAATEAGCLAAIRKGWAKFSGADARGATL